MTEPYAEILRLHRAGWGVTAIQMRLGVSRGLVYRTLRRGGPPPAMETATRRRGAAAPSRR